MLTTTTNSPLVVHVLEKTLAIRLEHRERNRWTLTSNELLWKAKCFSCLYSLNSADGECNRKLEITCIAYSNPDLFLVYSVPLSGTGQVVILQCLYKFGAEIISKLIWKAKVATEHRLRIRYKDESHNKASNPNHHILNYCKNRTETVKLSHSSNKIKKPQAVKYRLLKHHKKICTLI